MACSAAYRWGGPAPPVATGGEHLKDSIRDVSRPPQAARVPLFARTVVYWHCVTSPPAGSGWR